MTYETFIKLLAALRGEFTWGINLRGEIRGEREGKSYHPITAVALFHNAGLYFEQYDWQAACTYIDLPLLEGEALLDAVDFHGSPSLRRALYDAIGLPRDARGEELMSAPGPRNSLTWTQRPRLGLLARQAKAAHARKTPE